MVDGKVIEAGGPTGQSHVPIFDKDRMSLILNLCSFVCLVVVYKYRDLMSLTLKYAELTRPILSLPFFVGMIQGFFLEKLPENLFTVTRSQVSPISHSCPPSRLSLSFLSHNIEPPSFPRLCTPLGDPTPLKQHRLQPPFHPPLKLNRVRLPPPHPRHLPSPLRPPLFLPATQT